MNPFKTLSTTLFYVLLLNVFGLFTAHAGASSPPPEEFEVTGYTDMLVFDYDCFVGAVNGTAKVVANVSTEATMRPSYIRAEASLLIKGTLARPDSNDRPIVTSNSDNLITAFVDKDVTCTNRTIATIKGEGKHRATRKNKDIRKTSSAVLPRQ